MRLRNYSDLSIIILDLSPKVRTKSGPMCIFSPTEPVYIYPLVCMCVSMLDSHGRLYILCDCVFPCWTPTELVYPIVLMLDPPQSLNILLCECVFPCWTPTELVYPRVNVCFHAGLPQSLSIIRLYEKIGFELVALFKSLQR